MPDVDGVPDSGQATMTGVTKHGPATVWEQACPACAGSGQVTPPTRQQWLQTRDQLLRQREHAAGVVEAAILDDQLRDHAAGEPAGAQTQTCDACQGSGLVPTAEGQDLLRFLRRHRYRH